LHRLAKGPASERIVTGIISGVSGLWHPVPMFITVKRHEREKQQIAGASNRLTDTILKSSALGLFVLDAKDRIQPQVSASLGSLFRRQDFSNLSFEKLIAPVVSAKTLSAARSYIARLLGSNQDGGEENPLTDVEVRLPSPAGGFDSAHYSFDFTAVEPAPDRCWLVRVSDITARVQQQRELEDLRATAETHAEILRGVLQAGRGRFGVFLQKTDASMKTINNVLKKSAREADAFRAKLEETLAETDRIRRDAAGLKLAGLEAAARSFEDALQELRSRGNLSGGDFLPLAVKLDQLYVKFALIRTLTMEASAQSPVEGLHAEAPDGPVTESGTQIIEAPNFVEELHKASSARRVAAAGSLDSTLLTLTELVAQEHRKTVVLECQGLEQVPPRYQATIKNVSIQLIRNAVMHGVETPDERLAAGKPVHGTLQLEFHTLADQSYELLFQDDGRGLDPDKVRRIAVAKGLVSEDAASRLRDRQAIKLIFKSGFTSLPSVDGEAAHGAGMSLVRRYVHEAGGKIALASLLGHETRFKMTLPRMEAQSAQVA
jgi:two-component system chemotaxis sensor kinase CheA